MIGLVLALALSQAAVLEPRWSGDPEAEVRLGAGLGSALRSTEAFGPWPEAAWTVQLHEDDEAFQRATGAPTGRDACWMGATLHLRPWSRLQRRDLGALLRHELAHRRLQGRGWPRWQEEALCLWAEGHTRLPEPFPPAPEVRSRPASTARSRGGPRPVSAGPMPGCGPGWRTNPCLRRPGP